MTHIIIGAAAGALFGFLFYKFIGCRQASCRIAGNRWLSIVYWAVFGALAVNIIARLVHHR